MTASGFTERQTEIRTLHKEFGWFYRILGGLVLVLSGIWLGSQLFGGDNGYRTNLYTEALSIAVTVFVLNELARRRETRQLKEQRKADLIAQLFTRVDGMAALASEQLQRLGYLRDGSLGVKNFDYTNLKDVSFLGADFNSASFEGANLQRADLRSAKLEQAEFGLANLSDADLSSAHLRYADFEGANLKGVWLDGADLRGANLLGTNMEGAHISGRKEYWSVYSEDYRKLSPAKFDEETCLPDGSMWTPDTDMSRFTNPDHPNFFRPPEHRWLTQDL